MSNLQNKEKVSNFSQCNFFQQRVEILSSQIYPYTDPVIKVVICREHAEFWTRRVSSIFPENLRKVNK